VAHALAAEVYGLELLCGAGSALAVPGVIHFSPAEPALLAMEWLQAGPPESGYWGRFGEALATLHGESHPGFGLDRDNVIGMTPQPNAWGDHWPSFFRDRRLGHQERLVRRRGLWQEDWNAPWVRLLGRLDDELPDLSHGSLLHGDLWSGNCMSLTDGRAAIFDPAPYWGDPWVDIAMTRLFGGFPSSFYQGWEALSGEAGSAQASRRMEIYNLYHLLNHLLLFGSGYARAVNAAIQALGRE
jgi:fructosamine-3-kinase